MTRQEAIRKAARDWVETFNAIPISVIEKLESYDESISEVTPPVKHDRVYVYEAHDGEHDGKITGYTDYGYTIALDDGQTIEASEEDFEVEREGFLPMWGTMWTFGEPIDEEWLDGEHLGSHLKEMAQCGFRIYESEDFGHVFGIDGAGYDFYEEHWIPLYHARGLHWHEGWNWQKTLDRANQDAEMESIASDAEEDEE